MNKFLSTWSLIATLLLAAGACSDDDGGDGDGVAGTSGSGNSSGGSGGGASQAGTSGKGGSSSAGMTSGGSSAGTAGNGTAGGGTAGSGTGGGISQMACSPGKTIKGLSAYPDPIMNCGFEGTGELDGVEGFYRSIKLDAPLGPGDTYAFSVDLNGKLGMGSMELWGGSGECGEAHEKLTTVIIPPGGVEAIACMTAAPKLATYSYLIWVLHTAGAHGDVTFCPGVSCPG